MDVDRDRPGNKAKIRLGKRPRHPACIPTIIKSTIRHRIAFRENRRRILINKWNPDFVELPRNFSEPLVAQAHTGASMVRAIDISPAPKSVLLRRYRIDNHAAHRRGCRRIKPAGEQYCCTLKVADRAEILKVRVGYLTRNVTRKKWERRQLGINRGFVAI